MLSAASPLTIDVAAEARNAAVNYKAYRPPKSMRGIAKIHFLREIRTVRQQFPERLGFSFKASRTCPREARGRRPLRVRRARGWPILPAMPCPWVFPVDPKINRSKAMGNEKPVGSVVGATKRKPKRLDIFLWLRDAPGLERCLGATWREIGLELEFQYHNAFQIHLTPQEETSWNVMSGCGRFLFRRPASAAAGRLPGASPAALRPASATNPGARSR
jgi:hypothetical protein